jgi:hypothetical protein
MSWKIFFKKVGMVESYLYTKGILRGVSVKRTSGLIPKVKFVREQRIFAKGSRGPIKKRSTTLLRSLSLYLTSSSIQNIPPISTLLGLYGINVQKFCDDYNKIVKDLFYEGLPLKVKLDITKDLNFTFQIKKVRFNFLFQSLDCRFIGAFQTFLTTRSFNNSLVRRFYNLEESSDIEYRDFTFLDLWMLFSFYVYFSKEDSFQEVLNLSHESFIRVLYANLKSYQYRGVYRLRDFILLSNRTGYRV